MKSCRFTRLWEDQVFTWPSPSLAIAISNFATDLLVTEQAPIPVTKYEKIKATSKPEFPHMIFRALGLEYAVYNVVALYSYMVIIILKSSSVFMCILKPGSGLYL